MSSQHDDLDQYLESLVFLFKHVKVSSRENDGGGQKPKSSSSGASGGGGHVHKAATAASERALMQEVMVALACKPRKRRPSAPYHSQEWPLPPEAKRARLRELHAYCDGSFKSSNTAGVGGVVTELAEDVSSRLLVLSEGVVDAGNSTLVEVMAAERLLAHMLVHRSALGRFPRLVLHSDSSGLINALTNKSSFSTVTGFLLKEMVLKQQETVESTFGTEIQYEWVHGHGLSYGNIAADLLAKEACRRPDNTDTGLSIMTAIGEFSPQFIRTLPARIHRESTLQFDILHLFCGTSRRQFKQCNEEERLRRLRTRCENFMRQSGGQESGAADGQLSDTPRQGADKHAPQPPPPPPPHSAKDETTDEETSSESLTCVHKAHHSDQIQHMKRHIAVAVVALIDLNQTPS